MPIGGAALVYLAATLHLPRKRVEHRVDYLGAGLLAVAATAVVLLTTWGGNQYAWGSPRIITLGVIAAAAVAAFLMVEARVAEPILPLRVFRNRNFSAATGMSFLLGLSMFGALTFLPFYQQTVQHSSATGSGLQLIPLMLGSTVTSLIAGQVTSRTGRYKALPIIGGVIMTLGLYLLTHLGPHTSRLTSGIFFVILGVGMGFLMQITTLIVQNSVAPRDMGVATSSRTFFQQIGGSAMSARLPGVHLHASTGSLDPATINQLPPAVKTAAFFGISHAVDGVFLWTVPAAALVFVLALLIKEIPLRGRTEPAGEAPAQPAPEFVS
jgi:MFS family permease